MSAHLTDPIPRDWVICNTFLMILRIINIINKDTLISNKKISYPLSLTPRSFAFNHASCRIKHTSTETSIQLYIPSNSPSLERQLVVFQFRFCCYRNRRRQRSSVEHYNLNRWRHRACCHFLQNWCDILVKFSKLFNFHSELGLGLTLSICKP